MGVLLKFIFIGVLAYYILKSAVRLLLPFLGKKFEEKINQANQANKKIKREGEITIEQMKNKANPIDKNTGEYVDYEEINP
ncbi:MAG: hypothetical protein B6I20_00775 [Bacteroidetes bacterium 4572_117]|nr:MAG: hypothetical protein B6I20_00775 [Bacteroidetes bacterium 4572_117]